MKKLSFLTLSLCLITQVNAANKAIEQTLQNQNEFNKKLTEAGLYGGVFNPAESLIESSVTCSRGKPQSIPLESGIALSFCSNSNTDVSKVNKVEVLKLLLEKMQEKTSKAQNPSRGN